jgi:hypothetical protein
MRVPMQQQKQQQQRQRRSRANRLAEPIQWICYICGSCSTTCVQLWKLRRRRQLQQQLRLPTITGQPNAGPTSYESLICLAAPLRRTPFLERWIPMLPSVDPWNTGASAAAWCQSHRHSSPKLSHMLRLWVLITSTSSALVHDW